jgi:hypothetical protein
MYERFFKNAATSIIGLAILAFCGFIVVKAMNNGETVQEAATGVSGWIATGLLFLRSKNTILGMLPKDAKTELDNENEIK